jgi:hypothetical protein
MPPLTEVVERYIVIVRGLNPGYPTHEAKAPSSAQSNARLNHAPDLNQSDCQLGPLCTPEPDILAQPQEAGFILKPRSNMSWDR